MPPVTKHIYFQNLKWIQLQIDWSKGGGFLEMCMKKLEPEGTIQCPNLALGHYDQAPGLQDPKGGSTTLESSEA